MIVELLYDLFFLETSFSLVHVEKMVDVQSVCSSRSLSPPDDLLLERIRHAMKEYDMRRAFQIQPGSQVSRVQ